MTKPFDAEPQRSSALDRQPERSVRSIRTTPHELRWKPSTLRLAGVMKTDIVIKATQDEHGRDIFFGGFNPVRGPEFLRLLTAATRIPDDSLGTEAVAGVLSDWGLPDDASASQAGALNLDSERLDRIHSGDRVVGKTISEFVHGHLARWRNVLTAYEPTEAISVAEKMYLIDRNFYPQQFFANTLEQISLDTEQKLFDERFINIDDSPEPLHIFNSFLGTYQNRAVGDILTWRGPGDTPDWKRRFFELARNDKLGVFENYFNWLTQHPVEQAFLVEKFITERENGVVIAIDPQNADGYEVKLSRRFADVYGNVDITFNGEDLTVTTTDSGATVVRKLQVSDDNPAYPYEFIAEEIALVPQGDAQTITPVVAWRREVDPQTRAITRKCLDGADIKKYFGTDVTDETLATWDDWAGAAAFVGFAQKLRVSKVPERMHLEDESQFARDENGNKMGPGQISAVVNRPDFRRWIEADSDGIFASMEAKV